MARLVLIFFGVVFCSVLAAYAEPSRAVPVTPNVIFERRADGVCMRVPGQICTLFVSRPKRLRPSPRTLTPPPFFIAGAITPAMLQSEYSESHIPYPTGTLQPIPLPQTTPPLIMVVEYDHDPNAAADLNVFRSQFGLPSCTLATGCLTVWNTAGIQENPNDPSTYPAPDRVFPDGFSQEETMVDLDAASALCETCRLAIVEVDVNTENLTTHQQFFAGIAAARLIAPDAISLSYAFSELQTGGSAYILAGLHIPIFAASGDSGYERDGSNVPDVSFPASSPFVTAVGANYWQGVYAWPSSGSGCSNVFPTPAWQRSLGICHGRAISDISAQENYVPAYTSYCPAIFLTDQGVCGWFYGTGTSLSTPLAAALYAEAVRQSRIAIAIARRQHCTSAQIARIRVVSPPSGLYQQPSSRFVNVTREIGGPTCTDLVLCRAGPGWNGPTGLGAPVGTTTFLVPLPAATPPAHSACRIPYS